MKLSDMTPKELIQVLQEAVEMRDGNTIKAVKNEYNRRIKYDE